MTALKGEYDHVNQDGLSGHEYEVLRLYAGGKTYQEISDRLGAPISGLVAARIITDLAGSNMARAKQLVDAEDATAVYAASRPAEPPAPAASPPRRNAVAALVHAAEASPSAATRKLGQRFKDLGDALAARLTQEGEVRRQRQEAEKARTAAAAEVARLEADLAAARGQLAELAGKPARKPKPAKPAPDTCDLRAARQRALETGVDCPRTGRVPARVIDAWKARGGMTAHILTGGS